MGDVGLRGVPQGINLEQLIEVLEENNKLLNFILCNLTSDNVISIDTNRTPLQSADARLRLSGNALIVKNEGGLVVAGLEPGGVVLRNVTAYGNWDFSGANVTGI